MPVKPKAPRKTTRKTTRKPTQKPRVKSAADNAYLSRFAEIESQYRAHRDRYSAAGIRTTYEGRIEQHVWTLWGYVRDNQNSLNSDITCKLIRAAIDVAVADMQKQVDAMTEAMAKQKAELADFRRRYPQPKKKRKTPERAYATANAPVTAKV